MPYARPSQYPYPMCVAGSLAGESSYRYSTGVGEYHGAPWMGRTQRRLHVRFVDGAWLTPTPWPWANSALTGGGSSGWILRDTHGAYPLTPIVLTAGSGSGFNVLGQLDGAAHIPGFDNVVENTLDIDGVRWVVFQNVSETGPVSYWAQRMDN